MRNVNKEKVPDATRLRGSYDAEEIKFEGGDARGYD